MAEATKSTDTSVTTDQKAQTVAKPTQAPSGQPRNFLAVMALLVFGGIYGLHKIYTGDKAIGWTRFGVGVGAVLLAWIPFVGILSALAYLALFVWWLVDLFQVYLKNHTDAEGQAFVATERDKNWAKALFIAALVGTGLGVLIFIIMIILVAVAGVSFMNGIHEYQNDTNNDNTYHSRSYDDMFND